VIGRRVVGLDWHLWEPGDYGFSIEDGHWIGITPNDHAANLRRHKVTELGDGTITVFPSIAVDSSRMVGGKMMAYQVYHGYLEDGVWRNA
jgi:hypothetical protein